MADCLLPPSPTVYGLFEWAEIPILWAIRLADGEEEEGEEGDERNIPAGDSKETSHRDYPDFYTHSLIHNPNIRVKKPDQRPKKSDDCSDELLRKVMHQHITDEGMTESKRAIHSAVSRDFEGSWSVICAPCAFSYLSHSSEYCVHSRHGLTCLLYKEG
uniref:Ground-like domain-containing protein n=1 Tax=Caenorhabditis japonica TaxID=281687 RepID=A0A8R1IRI8_CAEJA